MSLLLVIALATLVLVDVDLGTAHRADDVAMHLRTGDVRQTDFRRAFARDEQDLVEGDGFLFAGGELIDLDSIARCNLVLPAAFFDDRVHRRSAVKSGAL